MSKEKVGDFTAYCGQVNSKGKYIKVGVVFKDAENDRLSVKIDALPLPGSGWEGWCNIFFDAEKGASSPAPRRRPVPPPEGDDDIPF